MDWTVVLFALGVVLILVGFVLIVKNLVKLLFLVALTALLVFAAWTWVSQDDKLSSSPAVKRVEGMIEKGRDLGSRAMRTGEEVKKTGESIVGTVKELKATFSPAGDSVRVDEPRSSSSGTSSSAAPSSAAGGKR